MNARGMTVGQFAKRTGLGVKALHHYDRIALLEPAWQDPANGYRRYTEEQVATGARIAAYRRLGVPLDLLRRLLDAPHDEVGQVLGLMRRRVESRLWRYQRQLHMLDEALRSEGRSMTETKTESDATAHRAFGVEYFNHTWTLLETEHRTREQDDEMIGSAHSSRFHWERAGGGPTERARGEWLISRVYSVLGRGEPAVYHAQRCRDHSEENGISAFDRAIPYEALARAHATLGEADTARQHAQRARELGNAIVDEEDRKIFEGDMSTLPSGLL